MSNEKNLYQTMKDKKGHPDKRILITLTFKMPTRQGTGKGVDQKRIR